MEAFLLLEDGGYLLLEDGGKIIVQTEEAVDARPILLSPVSWLFQTVPPEDWPFKYYSVDSEYPAGNPFRDALNWALYSWRH